MHPNARMSLITVGVLLAAAAAFLVSTRLVSPGGVQPNSEENRQLIADAAAEVRTAPFDVYTLRGYTPQMLPQQVETDRFVSTSLNRASVTSAPYGTKFVPCTPSTGDGATVTCRRLADGTPTTVVAAEDTLAVTIAGARTPSAGRAGAAYELTYFGRGKSLANALEAAAALRDDLEVWDDDKFTLKELTAVG